jgi:hypothetical protein
VLLSAIAGRAARKVFRAKIEIFTTEHTWAEVEEYLPYFIERYGLPMGTTYQTLRAAPVTIKSRRFYSKQISKANAYMKDIDPEDADVAALAFMLEAPVWSNDNDFKNFLTKRYTTAQLLKMLGYKGKAEILGMS